MFERGIAERGEPGERTLAAWELASLVSTAMVGEWVIFSVGGGSRALVLVPLVIAFVYMFLSHRAWGETPRELGWRLDNFAQASKLLAVPMIAVSILLITYGYLSGSLNLFRWYGSQSILGLPALGLLWGLMQQYVLQSFINRRAQIVFGRGAASVLLVALLFGALHLPNLWLACVTFLAGLLWAFVYQRAPNLFALAISHSLMTWVLLSSVPTSALGGMRVGYKFFG